MKKHLELVEVIDAKGGPVTASMGGDGHEQTSTRAGRFIIYSLEKHVSLVNMRFGRVFPGELQ